MDTLAFRSALGRFATGVCVITVNDQESGPLALTANSFSSVSLDPPLVLWSIQNNSECFREYTECAHFGISVLASHQESTSGRYARRGEHAIEASEFFTDPHGVPLLKECAANFSCRLWRCYEGGDHSIVVGEVVGFSAGDYNPLLFFGGRYDRLHSAG